MPVSSAGPSDRGFALGVGEAPASRAAAHRTGTLGATILGSSLAFIDSSVVNVGLPATARDLGADGAQLSWLINAYLLPVGALVLVGGVAGDRWGRKRVFLAGMAVFTFASLACALAPGFAALLAARVAQGVGAALLMPASLALLGAAFSGEARGRAVGTWAAAGAITGALGPLTGGWLIDTLGWRAIFLVNLPLAMAAAWLTWRYVEESQGHDPAPLDWRGAALATAGLATLTFCLTRLAERTGARLLLTIGPCQQRDGTHRRPARDGAARLRARRRRGERGLHRPLPLGRDRRRGAVAGCERLGLDAGPLTASLPPRP